MSEIKFEVRPRLRVLAGKEICLGPGKVQLLEQLEKTRSITQAARELKMSYMRAWTLIKTMNRCFKEPLVKAAHGGAHGGGGAELTPTGRKVLALYLEMETKTRLAIKPAQKKLEKFLAA